jgi:hypothetical protein
MPDHRKEKEGVKVNDLSIPIFRTMPGVVKMRLRSGIPCLLTPQEIFLKTRRRRLAPG